MSETAPTTQKWIRRSLAGLFAIYASAVFVIMLLVGSPDQAVWWVALIPLLIWAMAPIAATFVIAHRESNAGVLAVSCGLMTIAVISGIFIYISDMFGEDVRSTSAIVFIFLPIYQWVFPLLALGVAALGSLGKPTSR
jgi:hypothetical protein